MPNKLLLKNATLVCPERIIRSDLLIEGALIAKIDRDISSSDAEVIDCHELIVIPGLIDEHVHFRDGELKAKATIYGESRAAALGGVTSFMDMPNTTPAVTTLDSLEKRKAVAAKDSLINYAFYLGATKDNLEQIKRVDKNTVAGIKVYMGATTGDLLLDDYNMLKQVFAAAPTLVATHCEYTPLISAGEKRARAAYGDNIPFSIHRIIRNRDCCIASSRTAISLAKETGARLHILHISTKEEVQMLKALMIGSIEKRQISGEACIPHLYFSECDYDRLGGLLKCNPAVKTEQDRLALVNAVEDGIIPTVGTDHAPHEMTQKGSVYTKCASGCTSIQYGLLALCDLWKRGELSLESMVRCTSMNVAARYQLKNRGRIEEGAYADLALINPLKQHTVTGQDIASTCRWSPFLGTTFACSVEHTIANGTMIVKNGRINSDTAGMPLEFSR